MTDVSPEIAPQTTVLPEPQIKIPLTKRKYFIPSLLGILVFLALISYTLSWTAKKSDQAKLIPTPSPTPFQTYSGLKSTPQPVYYSYVLERKYGIYTDKILSFAPTEYYNDDHQLTRYKDYLFYVEDQPAESDPHPQKLTRLTIATGEKKVIYDSKSFQEVAKAKFSNQPYYYHIPFHIIDNTLFFSIITEGYDGSNPGPAHTFAIDLTNLSEPQKIAEIGGYIYHAKGHYWVNSYTGPCAECIALRSYSLLDPTTKNITPLQIQGQVIFISDNEIIYNKFQTRSFANNYTDIPPSIYSIRLTSPYTSEEIIPNSQLTDISDVAYIPSTKQFFLVGKKAFYIFKRETKEMEKIIDVNEWEGEKLNNGMLQDTFHTSYVDENVAYVPIGSALGRTPTCYTYTFATKTFKRVIHAEEKCTQSMKEYNNARYDKNLPPDDIGPEYKTLEEKIKSLKLPSNYIFRGM